MKIRLTGAARLIGMRTPTAGTSELDAWVGFKPNTPVREGVQRFVDWDTGSCAS